MTDKEETQKRNKRALYLLVPLAVIVAAFYAFRVLPSMGVGRSPAGKLILELDLDSARARAQASDDLVAMGEPAVKELIKALKGRNERIARGAAETLGRIGGERATDALIAALGDEEVLIRGAAALALAEMGAPGAVAPLIEMLHETYPGMASAAARALGKIGDERAVEPLTRIFNDPNAHAREAAGEALGKIGATGGVEALIRGLATEDAEVLGRRINALVSAGAEAVEPLIAALDNDSWQVRAGAVRALGEIGDSRAIDPLSALIEGGEPGERPTSREAVPRVTAAGGAGESYVRSAAVAALGQIGGPRVVPALIVRLKDPDPRVREAAVTDLGKLDDPRVVEAIAASLKDDSSSVRMSAAAALRRRKDAGAVEALIAALDDEDAFVRSGAVRALGEIGDRRAVEPLIGCLDDPHVRVRSDAAGWLGKLGDERAVEPLIGCLDDPYESVRSDAVEALSRLGGEKAIARLCEVLKDKDMRVRQTAARELRRMKDRRAIPMLKAALTDESTLDKGLVREVLEEIDPPSVEELAARMGSAQASEQAQQDAARELARRGEPGIKVLAKILEDKASKVRTVAARALGRSRDRGAIASLIAATKDGDGEVRKAAAWGLAWFNTPETRSVLDAALEEDALEIVAGGHVYYIRCGTRRCETALRRALAEHGDKEMAGSLLHCGDASLAKAAEAWLKKKGFPSSGMMYFSGNARWGEDGEED